MAWLYRDKTEPGNSRKGSRYRAHYATPLSWTIDSPDTLTVEITVWIEDGGLCFRH